VLIDALTRRTWIKEDDLAKAILLNAKQVRKALHYLEEERIVTRAHVKEKAGVVVNSRGVLHQVGYMETILASINRMCFDCKGCSFTPGGCQIYYMDHTGRPSSSEPCFHCKIT
jgi:hypothetical protein